MQLCTEACDCFTSAFSCECILSIQQIKPVVPNLFLTVAHFQFENFSWPYSQSFAQLQFSTSLGSSVARISQRRGLFWKFETSVNELDPNFHQSWIRLRRFFCQNQVISKKEKSLHQTSNGFSSRKQVISKKKVFASESAIFCVFSVDLKKNKNKSTRHSPQLSASFLTMSGNKQLTVQIRFFQTKMLCGPLQNSSMAHRLKTTGLNA